MDRFWLKNYPPGVPSDIDPSAYASVVSLFEESFSKHRDKQGLCLHGQGAHLRRDRFPVDAPWERGCRAGA